MKTRISNPIYVPYGSVTVNNYYYGTSEVAQAKIIQDVVPVQDVQPVPHTRHFPYLTKKCFEQNRVDTVEAEIQAARKGTAESMWRTLWNNDEQCFENIPADAWTFYIGGYQPAQKWLKDRKGRALSFDDIEHYRRIIAVLTETKRIMDTIDDPSLQVAELKHKVASLENQLKQKGKIVNYGTININDNSHNFHIK